MSELKMFEITLEAISFDGSQVFACYATDEQDAMLKLKCGECNIIESNIEVLDLDELPIDIMESDDITSRLLSDISVKQQEVIACQAEQIKMLREALTACKVNLGYYDDSFAAGYIELANKALSATEQK